MEIEAAIAEKLKKLPLETQREVLQFAEWLTEARSPKPPLTDPAGLWEEFDIDNSAEDIAELRREMSKNAGKTEP